MLKACRGAPQQPDPRKKGITVPISFRFEPKATEAQAQPMKDMAEPMEVAKRGRSEVCRNRVESMMRENVKR